MYLTDSGEVFYNSSQDIGGFQFNIDGATVNGGSGGDSAGAGFVVSAGTNTVLGFSFSGAVVPAGCGTLVVLDLVGNATGLSGIIISDDSGGALDFVYYDGGGNGGGGNGGAGGSGQRPALCPGGGGLSFYPLKSTYDIDCAMVLYVVLICSF